LISRRCKRMALPGSASAERTDWVYELAGKATGYDRFRPFVG
jgi:hypothetical protein